MFQIETQCRYFDPVSVYLRDDIVNDVPRSILMERLMVFTRISTICFLTASLSAITLAHAADAVVAKPAASATLAASAVKATIAPAGKVPTKTVPVATGAVIGKGGDSSIPAGSVPIPPKPKKEGLEAAGAIKAKAAQP